jgi:hypothetical protein
MNRLRSEAMIALDGRRRPGSIPPLWDGHAASRIVEIALSA